MARRGLPSTAHEYDERGQCIWCHMYRVNVLLLSHVCTPAREAIADKLDSGNTIDKDTALAKLKELETEVQNG